MRPGKDTMKFTLGMMGLVTLVLATPAVAADLPARTYVKAPVMIPVVTDWSGFYIGINGGGAWNNNCWTNTNLLGTPTVPVIAEGCQNTSGGMVGGQIGYRWQTASWVFGVEAEGDWTNLKGSNASLASGTVGFPFTNQTKVNAIGLFTGQVGYAWDNILWYVKGGAALADDKYSGLSTVFTGTNVAFDQGNEVRWGGAVGTGLEISFAPNWSVALEYDHLFMGTRNETLTALTPSGLPIGALVRTDSIKQDIDMATVRLNYRWGGPVIAKY
jgi:outer membrane immunogenic protein